MSDLSTSELAIETMDKKLFLKKCSAFFASFPHQLPLQLKNPVFANPEEFLVAAASFFRTFNNLYNSLKTNGDCLLNVFDIFGVSHYEKHFTQALAWFLDQNSSHGQKNAFLKNFLTLLPEMCGNHWLKPSCPEEYTVDVEWCCHGDASNRLDMIINAEKFIIIIEAKIYSAEHDNQLQRYSKLAQELTADKKWIVIYLTADGKPSRDCPDAYPLKWFSVVQNIRATIRGIDTLPCTSPLHLISDHLSASIAQL